MTFTKTLMMSAAAAAFVLAGASSGAMAFDASDCEAEFGAVSGGGSWKVEPSIGAIQYSSNGKNGTQTTTYTCVGYNKSGNPKGEEWNQELSSDTVKVCGEGKDANGNPYPACPL